ncbi:MAG: DUF2938 domain-containing protein [Lysobacteraceae bacterium]|nr:MAG: DUF2938 domain-containing protein [Xanthomonadaceae bacterium]
MDHLAYVLALGAGATALTDLWALARRRVARIALPDWGLVGRWFAWSARGRLRHASIKAAAPVRGERAIGWIAHYAIGMLFAALLLAIAGPAWMRQPTLAPALLVGVATVAAPFLVMQPAMGAGFAASRTPNPAAARMQSLVTHAVFGVGLYASGWLLHLLRLS